MVGHVRKMAKEEGETIDATSKEIMDYYLGSTFIYGISPSIYPRPEYWPENVHVLGHPQIDSPQEYTPSQALADFLDKHKKIMFVTFGSIVNPEPEKKTRMFLEIFEKHKIPAIINTADGGLVKPGDYEGEYAFFINKIPYGWILKKIHAAIHHGGSGTTHYVMKSGCASMILYHIHDQYSWSSILSKKGAGPKGLPAHKLRFKTLEARVLDLYHNQAYKHAAEGIAQAIAKENVEEDIYKAIMASLNNETPMAV